MTGGITLACGCKRNYSPDSFRPYAPSFLRDHGGEDGAFQTVLRALEEYGYCARHEGFDAQGRRMGVP